MVENECSILIAVILRLICTLLLPSAVASLPTRDTRSPRGDILVRYAFREALAATRGHNWSMRYRCRLTS